MIVFVNDFVIRTFIGRCRRHLDSRFFLIFLRAFYVLNYFLRFYRVKITREIPPIERSKYNITVLIPGVLGDNYGRINWSIPGRRLDSLLCTVLWYVWRCARHALARVNPRLRYMSSTIVLDCTNGSTDIYTCVWQITSC